MTPFTESTAAAAGARGGKRQTEAQRAALQRGRQARRGSGHMPRDPEAVRALLDAVRDRAAQPPPEGQGPNPRSLRSCAQSIGVSDAALRKWIAGRGWPSPPAVAALRAWLR